MLRIEDYKPGMIVYGRITGIKPYGAFVSFKGDVTGLIHISEMSERFVRDVSKLMTINEYVLVKVIDVDYEHRQLRLSFKATDRSIRKARKRARFMGLPENEIGFKSLKEKLAIWIKEGEEDETRFK